MIGSYGLVYMYPDSFISANILLRIQKFMRPRVSGFVAFLSVHTCPRKRYEYARNAYSPCALTNDEPAISLAPHFLSRHVESYRKIYSIKVLFKR